ncbi:GNAT family N-acetyltransferase [Granulicoccus sp. GXG6511]|uniref:GNAT family N-acetyltransferase n=1 Tax=Granulicoccus sp. GXG6511 TaxID=3381351 RepID=UPI003D7CBD51
MDLTQRTFRAVSDRVEDNPQFVAWWESVMLGFLAPSPQEMTVEWVLRESVGDNWLQRGCYDTSLPAEALSAEHPVGTFVSFDKSINVGGAVIPAHLITDVTVRPSHRRRGVLRRMMVDDLAEAHEKGHALAALTVTEATIYGRFGFGPATFVQSVRLNTSTRFGLRTPSTGRVELTSQDQMGRVGAEIFERHQAITPGAVGRGVLYAEHRSGIFDPRASDRNRSVRNALHFDDDGRPDGLVCYDVREEGGHYVLTVRDLVAVGTPAYLGLWEFLAGIDRVEQIDWPLAPIEDPLRWALVDQRAYEVTGIKDHLWLRILDPVAALSARRYSCPDQVFTLAVTDDLGLANGTYRIDVADGRAEVTRSADEPDATVGVEELGSIYLGGVPVRQLHVARRIGASDEAADRLGHLLGGVRRPYCNTDF